MSAPPPRPLPDRPRLKSHVAVVPMGANAVLLKGPGLFVRYSGEAVDVVLALLPLLDGTATSEEVVARSRRDPADARDVLAALVAENVVEDAAQDAAHLLPAAERARIAPQLRYLSHASTAPAEAMNRLVRANVLLLGDGALADEAARTLDAARVGKVQRASLPMRADADERRALLQGHDHVLLATDTSMPPLFLDVNAACLELGARWTGAFLDQHEAIVGPTVLPGETACWRCYDLRAKGAHPRMDRLLAYEGGRWSEGAIRPERSGLPSFAAIAGAWAGQAVVQTLAQVTLPPLAGKVLRVEPLELHAETHRVLRLPRCPACGGGGVPDVDRYALDRVDLG